MKLLEINPTGYEITVRADGNKDDGYKNVFIKLSSDSEESVGAVTKTEAQKIGEWFLKLAKEIK